MADIVHQDQAANIESSPAFQRLWCNLLTSLIGYFFVESGDDAIFVIRLPMSLDLWWSKIDNDTSSDIYTFNHVMSLVEDNFLKIMWYLLRTAVVSLEIRKKQYLMALYANACFLFIKEFYI